MKRLILSFLLISPTLLVAQDNPGCDENNNKLTDLTLITGKKCLTDDVGSIDLEYSVVTPPQFKEFCESCKSEALNKTFTTEEAKNERETLYGKAILNEFQKNLTFLTVDLMRIRSAFKLDFEGTKAIKSCHFKNLKKPTCLTKDQEALYDQQVLSIQNSMAQEMANILSENPKSDKGLLDRSFSKNQCSLSDREVLYAQSRYIESLVTPELILKLKKLNIPKGVNVLAHVKKIEGNAELETSLHDLSDHPLFNMLISDSSQLNQFISEVSSQQNNESIIEKLYSSKIATNFEKSIEERCEHAFSKTSQLISENFCDKEPHFIADNLSSMENLVGDKFIRLTNEQAEPHLQVMCSHINTSTQKMKSFESIQKALNFEQDLGETKEPIKSFKQMKYERTVQNTKNNICEAKNGNPDCKVEKNSTSCQMLHFLELSKTSKPYQDMAKASGDNINLILRSLVGEGKPESQEHLVLLQNEGILPGGSVADKPVQTDPGTFHKTVSSSGPVNPNINNKSAGPTIDPKTNGRKTAFNNQNEESGTTGTNFAYQPKNSGSSKNEPEFSNLSDDEQDAIMDRLGRMKNGRKNKRISDNLNNNEDFENSNKNHQKNFFAKPARGSDNMDESTTGMTPLISGNALSNNFSANGGSGSAGANSRGAKGLRSFNSALLKANENQQSGGSSDSPTVNQLSKTKDGENEINIQVPDAELVETLKFKEKLKELLAVHNQELSVVKEGEKFLVKLNDYLIDVEFDAKTGLYSAKCRNGNIPVDYEKTISNYFNVTLKQGPGKIKSLKEAFHISRKN